MSSAVCICMASCGYDTRAAHSERAALRVLSRWRPNLVIANFHMHGITTAKFCRRLRSVARIPIILLCATVEERTEVELLNIAACDFLMKPFSLDQLLERVVARSRTRPKHPSITTAIISSTSAKCRADHPQ
jgi:DNA-binding response OmpR family regulator